MGYPGYQQQHWQAGYQQPPTGYAGPDPNRSGPGLAVTTGIIGLGVGGVLLAQTIMLMSDLDDALQLPTGWVVMNIMHFVVAAFALLGAVLVFVRQIAGAFLLMTGAVLAVAVLLLDPAIAHSLFYSMLGALPDFEPSGEYGNYFKAMFEFGNEQAVLRFTALALGVVLLITAVLPPSLNWLRGARGGSYPRGW